MDKLKKPRSQLRPHIRMTLYVHADTQARLKSWAKENQLSASEVIRDLVGYYLPEVKEDVK